MAYHNQPAIEYGNVPALRIEFDMPEKGLGDGDQPQANSNNVVSLSGRRQVSLNFVENIRKVSFAGLTEAKFALLKNFFLNYAVSGKPFKYFEDQKSLGFAFYELSDLKFANKKTSAVTANTYLRQVDLTFRRVENQSAGDILQATILNNQLSPAPISGVVLDQTLYTSARIYMEIRRRTDMVDIISVGYVTATFRDDTNAWAITPQGTFDHDWHGLTFSMVGAQVSYISDNTPGTNYNGIVNIKSLTL